MSAKVLIDQLMKRTSSRNHSALAINIGMPSSTISKIYSEKRNALTLRSLKTISSKTGIPVSQLAGWWAGEP